MSAGNKLDLTGLSSGVGLMCLQFAAHPSCQKKLTSLWFGDGHFDKLLRRRSKLIQIFVIACIAVLYPVLSFIYVIAPNSLVSAMNYIASTKLSMFLLLFVCASMLIAAVIRQFVTHH